ncbi:glycosyl hydrolase [Novosphingobium malaysiense]|uniref:glycosyl hydrolase n=1 Tax=Novosphingobium malaysiense TaxID=1348853 RepID=UPI001E4570F2|nr:glycosyl hydrolase [Novosphingobium malaysiense]
MSAQAAAQDACGIDHADKIGAGVWPIYGDAQLAEDIRRLDLSWHYNWRASSAATEDGFVPMIWSGRELPASQSAKGDTLLTFNEPDKSDQANMPVELALAYWPTLMASHKRLGSPAVSTGNEIGPESWLGEFMQAARARNYRVDFIAVHYYAANPDIEEFKRRLSGIHEEYALPLWITEWALADWKDPDRYSVEEQLQFFRDGSEMLDDLPFVERHAWFGLYDGLDDWNLNSGLIAQGHISAIGLQMREFMECPDRGVDQP